MKYFTWNLVLNRATHLIISIRYQKLIFISTLLFLILLNQNIIRTIKNSLVVTLIEPEIISFIKLYIEVPLTFLILIIYIKLYNLINAKTIFNSTLIIFAIFFAIFAFVLLPNLEIYTIDKIVAQDIINHHPYLKWMMQLLYNWPLILFYVIGELWTAILYSLLLWELINRITTVENSKKDYPIFNFFGQLSTIISGVLIIFLYNEVNVKNIKQPLQSLSAIQLLISIVIFSIILILCIHTYINKISYTKNNNKSNAILDNAKASIVDNFKFIFSSTYVLLISINVMCYGIVIMIIEGLWFAKARELYPLAEDFINYQSKVLIFIGLTTLLFSILSNYLAYKINWLHLALITPYIFISFGSIFVLSCVTKDKVITEFTLIPVIVFLGSLTNILGKGAKYAFFDITKEMCYVPLNNALKAKAKAVIDVFCFHLGKMFGALLPFIIFSIFPNYTYNDIITYLLAILIIVCLVWIVTIKKLSIGYSYKLGNTNN